MRPSCWLLLQSLHSKPAYDTRVCVGLQSGVAPGFGLASCILGFGAIRFVVVPTMVKMGLSSGEAKLSRLAKCVGLVAACKQLHTGTCSLC